MFVGLVRVRGSGRYLVPRRAVSPRGVLRAKDGRGGGRGELQHPKRRFWYGRKKDPLRAAQRARDESYSTEQKVSNYNKRVRGREEVFWACKLQDPSPAQGGGGIRETRRGVRDLNCICRTGGFDGLVLVRAVGRAVADPRPTTATRRLPLPRPAGRSRRERSSGRHDGAAAVAMPTKRSKLRDDEEEEVEEVVKDKKEDVQSAAVTFRSRITSKLEKDDAYKYDDDDDDDDNDDDDDAALPSVSDPRQWMRLIRCSCEEGGGFVVASSFLPPGLVQDQWKSAAALLQLGAGGCYHKATGKKLR
jgi:hypothetical protein